MPTRSRVALAIIAALVAPCSGAVVLMGPEPPTESIRLHGVPSADALARGFRAIEAGKLDVAEDAMREAIRLDGKSPGGYIGMAEIAAQRRKKAAEVEAWIRRALEVDPNGEYTLRVWGKHLFRVGRFADAEASLRKAVAAAPDSLNARLNLGEVQLRGLKNPKAAEATYREALARFPGHAGATLALAAAIAAQGRAEEARVEFEAAAKGAPRDPEPLLALARFQASRTEIDAALATLDRLIDALPDTAQAFLDRGDLLLLKNDPNGAIASYRAMTKLGKDTAPGHFRIATLLEARQQWSEAEESYRAAIRAAPGAFAAYNNLAFMLANRGEKLEEAERLAQRANELAPKAATVVDTLGWVQRARGKLTDATSSFERAIKMQPGNPLFHYHLGIVQGELGRKSEARVSLQRALQIDPKFRWAGDAKGRLAKLGAG